MSTLKSIAVAILAVVLPTTVFAVSGRLDYNTYMFHDYQNNWQPGFYQTQWANQIQWMDEMNDIATCYQCAGNSALNLFLRYAPEFGLDADLIAVATHGWSTGSRSTYKGHAVGWQVGDHVASRRVIPVNGEAEIYIWTACSFLPRDRISAWYGFRNPHRFGALVSAGCWGTCNLVDTAFNTTWNEIGDEIADGESTINRAWTQGNSVGWAEDDVIIYGLGRVGARNCDNRARNVSLQNRLNYYQYEYGVGHAYSTAPNGMELCGYYGNNI